MLELTNPVTAVPKIGPKYRVLLEKLGIRTVEELLYHFPFRYDDYSVIKNISDLNEGDVATVQGVLGEVKNIFTKYGKRLTQTDVLDQTGKVNVIWFNSHYLKKSLKQGEKYSFSGKVGKFGSKLNLVAPTYELLAEQALNTGRLIGVYPETSGVSSKWIRGKINEILLSKLTLDEFLPEDIISHEKFPKFGEALNYFHFPTTQREIDQARKRFALEELLIELINVENRKAIWQKQLHSRELPSEKYENNVNELIKTLPFELSESQKSAIVEIKSDLNKTHPMNRLLEGDVGTGKTMVAIISAYISYLNGKNVLYMSPTEILSKQHYDTFKKVLEPLGANVHIAMSSLKTEVAKEPYILIGTHSLLFKEDYSGVGLVIIDEQHRFGVEQRTKLASLDFGGFTPHLLTMTATPIPRTLALTIYGDLEISQLRTILSKEKKIKTKVVPEKLRDQHFEWIRDRGEQTFIVCPFILESSHEDFENVRAATVEFEKLRTGVFKNLKIGLLHGKMTSEEKRGVVERFEKGEIQILVSTPVIEVGIDIPEAAVMVIESAERYGLASLHQLRGRIGRMGQEGHCFIFMSSNNRSAYNRLKYLETVNNGLELAEIDLELRGSGDIYGTLQHGFKRFKVARLSDLETLEKAKEYSAKYFPQIDNYPKLKKKIYDRLGRYVGNN